MNRPQTIAGRYEILKPLGQGSGGTCFLVRDQAHPQEWLALKTLNASQAAPEIRQAFLKECEILRQFSHPHLARVFDYGEDGPLIYYVSEYVEGMDFVSASRNLDWNAVFSLIVQGSWALDYLESEKILHRDIKPDNILVGKIHSPDAPDSQDRLRLKLIDFGLAAKASPGGSAAVQGTLAYMAPEVLAKRPYDHRADLYSWGVVLYQMAWGRLPFSKSKNFSQYLEALANQEIDLKPLEASGEIPQGVLQILRALVQRAPERRMKHAREIILSLNKSEGENFPLKPDTDPEISTKPASPEFEASRENLSNPEALEKLLLMVRSGERGKAWDWAQNYLPNIQVSREEKFVEKFLGTMGHILIQQGRYPEAQAWLEKMKEHPALREKFSVEACILLAQLELRQGHFLASRKILESITEEIWALTDLEQKTRLENTRGLIAQSLGENHQAAEHFSQGACFAERSGRRDHQLSMMVNAGSLYQQQGQWTKAYELFLQSENLARELQHFSLLANILNNLGNLYLYFGRLSEAERSLLKSLQISKQQGLKPLIAYNLYLLTIGEEARGNWEKVQNHLEEALQFASELGEAVPRLQALLAQAYFFWGRGDLKACEASLDQVKALAEKSEQEGYLRQAHWLEAKLRIERSETNRFPIKDWLQSVEQDAQARGLTNNLWQISSDLGDLAQLEKDYPAARRHYQEALSLIEALNREVPEKYRASFLRDRKKEKIRKTMEGLPAPTGEPAISTPELAFTETSSNKTPQYEDIPMVQDPTPLSTPASPPPKGVSFQKWSEINRRLLAQHDIDNLLEEILDAALALTDAERGFVILSETQEFHIRAARNIDQKSLSKEEEKFSSTIAKEVMRKGVSTVLLDAQADDHFSQAASVHALSLRSVLCVPLKSGNRSVGVVYLDNRFRQGVFLKEHIPQIEALADQASLALEHARLHQENREKILELKKSKDLIENLNARLEKELQVTAADLQIARESLKREHEEIALRYSYDAIVGKSKALRSVLKVLDKVVESHANVFVFGESGTGKELIAQAIHYNSPRKGLPFISENCAALAENLLESELFGHVRGAFTGAERDKLGLFHLANHGTLFLDEVGDMSLTMQAKLLRVLQEGEVRQVGAKDYRKVDVRVVSASNKNLKDLVDKGEFRQDLYYRLHVLRIDLPPLRKRREDIPMLIEHFLKKPEGTQGGKPRLSRAALKILLDYDWPGNIRELQNEMQRLKVLSQGDIPPELLSPQILASVQKSGQKDFQGGLDRLVSEVEKNTILEAMEKFRGNKVKVAKALKIGRRTLYAKLDLYKIESKHGKA